MYRTIMVDDEIWSLIGFRKILEKQSARFQLIGEYTSPVEALNAIIKQHPDVVFVDIRMPEMSGIELMYRVREAGLGTEFVVISGHAEFTYAQQALRAGAFDYQLKPVDAEGFFSLLDRLFLCLNEKANSRDIELYSMLREGREDAASFLEKQCGRPVCRYLQAIEVLHSEEVPRLSKRTFVSDDHMVVSFRKGLDRSVLLLSSDNQNAADTELNWLFMQPGVCATSVSRIVESFGECGHLLLEVEQALEDRFLYPKQKVFYTRPSHRDLVDRFIENFQTVRKTDPSQINDLFEEIGTLFSRNNMGMRDAVYLWNRFAANSIRFQSHENPPLVYTDQHELAERFSDFDGMCKFLKAEYTQKEKFESSAANAKFLEILDYIDANYQEQLYLKDLCSNYYINMNYCCELFRKYKNTTFSQYLTDVRIKKACELLKNGNMSVADICTQVGYHDYFYFNKVFKKVTGTTPARYRSGESVAYEND